MTNLPLIKDSIKILIVCEGYEEYDYLNRLKSLNVWSHNFSIDIKNARSIDNIASVYQYNYAANDYKLIVIFCDTEKAPYEKFLVMKEKIKAFHNKKSIDSIVFFANPCTMQIILSHFANISLKSNLKSDNASTIKKLTGINNYVANENQRKAIINKINANNYQTMKNNIVGLSQNYETIPSSNVIELFVGFEAGNNAWIKSITKKIEG